MDELVERVAKLEMKSEEHSKLLDKQQQKNDVQTELNTLLKLQIESNKEQNETLKKFGDTLDKVNVNLTNLNSKQELLDDRVTGIEGTLQSHKIDPMKLFKSIIGYIVTAAAGGIVLYIYMKLGIKN